MKRTHYRMGTYNAICEVCGFQYKADEMVVRHDGLFVCQEDDEVKHPLEFSKIPREAQPVPLPSLEPAPLFIEVNYLTD